MQFRADIQGLRAIAILSVIGAHAGVPGMAGGFVGVDVFFVISGYLITGLLLAELRGTQTIAWGAFILRRLRRLLPALVVMLGCSLAAAAVLLLPGEVIQMTASSTFAATWSSNLYFANATADYFAALAGRDLFIHTWSLGVEEQFYLAWPLLLLIAARLRASLPSTFMVVVVAGFAACCWLTWQAPLHAFYQMPARMWEFAVGASLVVARREASSWIQAILSRRMTTSTGLLLIGTGVVWLHEGIPYPGVAVLLPVAGTALVIGGHTVSGPTNRLLSHRLMIWLGDRSYSWYLWHWPCLMLWRTIEPGAPAWQTALVVAASLALADLSYRWVELPFWKGRLHQLAPRTIVACASLAVVAIVTASALTLDYSSQRTSTAQNAYLEALGDLPAIYPRGCDGYIDRAYPDPCFDGNQSADRTVILFGDSIAAQWYSMLLSVFDQNIWRIIVFTKSSCAMVDEDYYFAKIGRQYDVCTQWRNAVIEDLHNYQPDIVIVGGDTRYGFTAEQWRGGTQRVVSRIAEVADSVLLMAALPSLDFFGPTCLARHAPRNDSLVAARQAAASCHTRVEGAEDRLVAGYQRDAITGLDNVHLVDLSDMICPDRVCSALSDDGIVVFRDDIHLTDTYVRHNAARVGQRLLALPLHAFNRQASAQR
ncbi:MAG: acyltransferase [Gammaproteobacteria bacterium]|nr:acyltransferase [Gammaproteobacteria bacterium]